MTKTQVFGGITSEYVFTQTKPSAQTRLKSWNVNHIQEHGVPLCPLWWVLILRSSSHHHTTLKSKSNPGMVRVSAANRRRENVQNAWFFCSTKTNDRTELNRLTAAASTGGSVRFCVWEIKSQKSLKYR